MRIVRFVLMLAGLLALLVVPALAQDATPTPVPGQQAQTTPEASPAAQTEAETQAQVQIPAGPGFVQFANFLTEAGVIDVYVNDQLAFADVNPNAFSRWLELPSGSHNITVVPAGMAMEEAIIGPFNLIAGGNARMTIAATGSGETGVFNWKLIREGVAEADDVALADNPRIRLLHNIEDAPMVNVELTLVEAFEEGDQQPDPGTVFTVGAAGFSDDITDASLPAGLYNITIVPSSAQAAVTDAPAFSFLTVPRPSSFADWPRFSNVALNADTNYLFALVGTEQTPWLAIQTSDLGSPVSATTMSDQTQATTDMGTSSQGTQAGSEPSEPTYP